jgi:PAS domain-containing protein
MRFDWRAICGPALTTATALIAISVDRHFLAVPDPAPLFVCAVAFAASLSSLGSGMISAAIAVAASALFVLNHRATPGHDLTDLVRLAMLAIAATGTAVITGLLRKKLTDTFAWKRKHHSTAERLSAALDQVDDIGIVLLDSDTRAEFINRAFRDYFSLPDAKTDSKPPFIARRTEMMRSGDSTPINIKLADGKVLRFSCTALPDVGRMLSYTPVTDLVRYTDHASNADHQRSLHEGGDHGLIRHLRAAE